MPKLSAYVHQQPFKALERPPEAAAAATVVPLPTEAGTGQSQAQQLAQPPAQQLESLQRQAVVTSERQGLDQLQGAAAKLQADHAKRLREHGPARFRWPDGSLRLERPPPNPHAVVRLG